MSTLSRASIGVALALILAIGATWVLHAPPDQSATPDRRSRVDSVEQPSRPVEPDTVVADHPLDPQSSTTDDVPAVAEAGPPEPEAVPLDLTEQYRLKASAF